MSPLTPAPADDELLASIGEGDGHALSTLYERYCDRALRVARAVCGEGAAAEDAVQEGFLSLWRSGASFQPQQGTAAAWILAVIRHRAIDLCRHSMRHTSRRASDGELERHACASDVAEEGVAQAEAGRMRALLATLPETQRDVITLAYYGELSHSEIAAHLALPPGTVKGRMRLGLEKLRAEIGR
jgi:RNA polymerase sigma-70 factor, ECF subfamily